jgi:hypothetical protein
MRRQIPPPYLKHLTTTPIRFVTVHQHYRRLPSCFAKVLRVTSLHPPVSVLPSFWTLRRHATILPRDVIFPKVLPIS